MNKSIIILVMGTGTCALGQIRCAHQAGYQCYNFVGKSIQRFSAKSKYCKKVDAPDPFKESDACKKFTLDFIKKLPSKPYLFFADDEWMMLVGENEQEFLEVAHIVQSPWAELVQLYDKRLLYRLAEKHGIPHPKTIEIETLNDLEVNLDKITFPCIVKPQLTVKQNEISEAHIKTYHRTQTFNSKEEAMAWVKQLIDAGIDMAVVMQEFIPGDATHLYTLTSYSDKEGALIAGAIGHKLRQFPPEAGRITSGVIQYDDKLKQTGEHFLKTIGFHGVANTEFKYDERDGQFKLMEINARFGAWNYSTLYAGINLMEIAINDYNGIPYTGPQFKTDKDGYIWYNFAQDFGCTVILNKDEKFKKHRLTARQWKKSLGEHHFEGVWDRKDMKPFLFEVLYLIIGKIKGNSPV